MTVSAVSAPLPQTLSTPAVSQSASHFSGGVAKPSKVQVLRFSGKALKKAGKNGVWVSVEREPVKVGGLGEVSKTIPAAIQKYSPDKDLRVMVPYMAPMDKEGGYQSTGLIKQLAGPNGQIHSFELLQKHEQDTGTWVYAIKNDTFFGRFNDLYLWRKAEPGIGKDSMFKAMMMFNRAAAAFLPELNASSPQQPGTQLTKFDGDADFIITNDWHTGPLLSELPEDYQVGKLFMLHNTFDEQRRQLDVKQSRLKVPGFLARRNPKNGEPTQSLKTKYSPLSIGMKLSDGIIANANYVRTITLTDFAKGSQFVPFLKEKLLQGRVFDMHHGLSDEFNAFDNAALKTDGFTELKPTDTAEASQAEMARFKAKNKKAMQKMLGLKPDPNAVVMNWIARFDPMQKGFYLLMDETESLLKQNPHLQLVIAGVSPDPRVIAWVDRLNADPSFKGRLYLPNQFVNKEQVVRINSGSDFTILPSLYEPYGLTQLEAKKLGSIPIVHGVDGLRSTVADPHVHGKDGGPDEKVWAYEQTGIMMQPLDVPAYRKALGKQAKGTKLNVREKKALADAQAKFQEALERAIRLAEDTPRMLSIRKNAMRFVDEEHRWEPIVKRYDAAIDTVVAENNARKSPRFAKFA